jgi:hypothetical protein
LAPLGLLAAQAFGYAGGLGANDVETILNVCGKTGLNLLILTLCITPIRRSTGINKLVVFRRLLGLFAFFYLTLHFLTYALLDLGLLYPLLYGSTATGVSPTQQLRRRHEAPFITVGFTAPCADPLAITDARCSAGSGNWTKLPARASSRCWGRALLVAGQTTSAQPLPYAVLSPCCSACGCATGTPKAAVPPSYQPSSPTNPRKPATNVTTSAGTAAAATQRYISSRPCAWFSRRIDRSSLIVSASWSSSAAHLATGELWRRPSEPFRRGGSALEPAALFGSMMRAPPVSQRRDRSP